MLRRHTHTHTHIRMCDVLCLHPLVGVEGPPQSVSGLCAHAYMKGHWNWFRLAWDNRLCVRLPQLCNLSLLMFGIFIPCRYHIGNVT